jgi:uncharacterized protein GlcG (DUF336 family)
MVFDNLGDTISAIIGGDMKDKYILNIRPSAAAIAVVIFLIANTSSVPSQELMTQKALPVDMALAIAEGALEQCRSDGSRVSVTVVDGTGLTKVFIRDDRSGPHTIDLSQRKAYTAFTYQRTSGEQARYWASLPPPPFTVNGTVALPGGVPIKAGNEVIGAIGVSGSAEPPPGKDLGVLTGNADEKCAMAGLSKVANKLK